MTMRMRLHQTLCTVRNNINEDFSCGMIPVNKGIGHKVEFLLEDLEACIFLQELLQELFPKWPEFSGDMRFPVPTPASSISKDPEVYYRANHKWVGEYGASRLRLLDFLIEETR